MQRSIESKQLGLENEINWKQKSHSRFTGFKSRSRVVGTGEFLKQELTLDVFWGL